jgi:hypothetical protein
MGIFSDIGKFELFNLKDMFGKIKDDPERLFLGAIDPMSSKMWGGVLGKKYEPLVDQMGGAYGGHMLSAFGNKDGGVYGRAKEAGIDTGPGGAMHDAAHVLSALFAGGYGADKLSGVMPSNFGSGNFGSGGMGNWQQYMQMMPQGGQQPQQHPYVPPGPYAQRPYTPPPSWFAALPTDRTRLKGLF